MNIPSIELVSTIRSAPQNGSISSSDYNDSWAESLADLASLSSFVNDTLIPMLNGLSATIQSSPTATPDGIEGRYLITDTSDTTTLFYDSLSGTPLSVADSLRILQGIITNTKTLVTNLNVQVTALQTQLSSTNQNDIAQTLQNFTTSLLAVTSQVTSNSQAISILQQPVSITMNSGHVIYTGVATTRAAVLAQVGTTGAIGSIYMSTAGKLYVKVANANLNTDWAKVTTTATD